MVSSETNSRVRVVIVCSCNVLTEADIRSTLKDVQAAPRRCSQVYGCLGCSAQCGRCAQTIRRIMDEALTGAAAAGGCDHVSGAGGAKAANRF